MGDVFKKIKKIIEKLKRGFTLVELLAVIVILAIIMLIAIPAVLNTLESARRKTFAEYVDKVVSLTEQKELSDELLSNTTSEECTIYDITKDLDLSSTGDYKGYTLVKKTSTGKEYIVVLWDGEYMIRPYNYTNKLDYSKKSMELSDAIENYSESSNEELTISSLCAYGCKECTTQSSETIIGNQNTLYNVLKQAAKEGTYVREYTGPHQDSMDKSLSTEKIYYWYGSSNSIADEILEKNNVIFAGFCWQTVRTTDTGGIKMIYNGPAEDGKCLSSRTTRIIGNSKFNDSRNSLSDVGYMYNTKYSYSNRRLGESDTILYSADLSTSYWYSDSVSWGNPKANTYNLIDAYQVSSTDDYSSLVGKYTFNNSSETYTYNNVRYITAINNNRYYYFNITKNENPLLDVYTYGTSYTDNGDGTFTINDPVSMNRKDWYTNYKNVASKYICKNATNNTCSDLKYTSEGTIVSLDYIRVNYNYKYSKSFTWNGSKYILDDDSSITFWNIRNADNISSLNNAHYTCFNKSGECTTLSYIFYRKGTDLYYIYLKNGKSVEDVLNEMLYNDDVNKNDSPIKAYIDTWYENNLASYSNYLEDTIFCNDRSQSNLSTNGWNPNGGNPSVYVNFGNNKDLSCGNETDKFSTLNNKAKLKYKIGLMTTSEMNLLNNNKLKNVNANYWLGSPQHFFDSNAGRDAYVSNVSTSGTYPSKNTASNLGVRPAISLAPGTEFTGGDGSTANPYVVG